MHLDSPENQTLEDHTRDYYYYYYYYYYNYYYYYYC